MVLGLLKVQSQNTYLFTYLFICFSVLEIKAGASCLLEKCSTNLATPTDHFLEPVCLSFLGVDLNTTVWYITYTGVLLGL